MSSLRRRVSISFESRPRLALFASGAFASLAFFVKARNSGFNVASSLLVVLICELVVVLVVYGLLFFSYLRLRRLKASEVRRQRHT
jgi:amino acid permease